RESLQGFRRSWSSCQNPFPDSNEQTPHPAFGHPLPIRGERAGVRGISEMGRAGGTGDAQRRVSTVCGTSPLPPPPNPCHSRCYWDYAFRRRLLLNRPYFLLAGAASVGGARGSRFVVTGLVPPSFGSSFFGSSFFSASRSERTFRSGSTVHLETM